MGLWYSLLSGCNIHSNSPCFVLSSHSNRSWIDDNFLKRCVDDKQFVIHSSREIYCKILTCGSLIFTAAWLHQPCFVTSLTKSPVTVPLGELIWTLSGVDKFFLSNLHPNFKSLMSFSAMITKVSYMTLQGALHNVVKVYPCTKSDQYISCFVNEVRLKKTK